MNSILMIITYLRYKLRRLNLLRIMLLYQPAISRNYDDANYIRITPRHL